MPNWKEGIDWVGDPTGATALDDHVFIAPWGTDAPASGSHTSPYATLLYAVTQEATANLTYVMYTGVYTDVEIDFWYGLTIKGDGYVLFKNAGTNNLFTTKAGNTAYVRPLVLNNIIFLGYTNIIYVDDYFWDNTATPSIISKCVFLGTGVYVKDNTSNNTTQILFDDSVFINSDVYCVPRTKRVLGLYKAYWSRNIFINSPVETNHGLLSCFLDEDSPLTITDVLMIGETETYQTQKLYTHHNNIRGSITFEGSITGFYASLSDQIAAHADINEDSIDSDPKFNNAEGGDFSLKSDSPHIGSGFEGENIGGTSFGISYFLGSPWLDAIINSSGNLSYNGEGEIQVAATTTVESGEFVETTLRYSPILDLCGFPDIENDAIISLVGNDRLIYEMAWAGLDGVYGDWQKFRFGEPPYIDSEGVYSGEDAFRWGAAELIPLKKRKYRFTFKQNIAV